MNGQDLRHALALGIHLLRDGGGDEEEGEDGGDQTHDQPEADVDAGPDLHAPMLTPFAKASTFAEATADRSGSRGLLDNILDLLAERERIERLGDVPGRAEAEAAL